MKAWLKRHKLTIALALSLILNVAQVIRNASLWQAAAMAEGHLDMCLAYAKGEWHQ